MHNAESSSNEVDQGSGNNVNGALRYSAMKPPKPTLLSRMSNFIRKPLMSSTSRTDMSLDSPRSLTRSTSSKSTSESSRSSYLSRSSSSRSKSSSGCKSINDIATCSIARLNTFPQNKSDKNGDDYKRSCFKAFTKQPIVMQKGKDLFRTVGELKQKSLQFAIELARGGEAIGVPEDAEVIKAVMSSTDEFSKETRNFIRSVMELDQYESKLHLFNSQLKVHQLKIEYLGKAEMFKEIGNLIDGIELAQRWVRNRPRDDNYQEVMDGKIFKTFERRKRDEEKYQEQLDSVVLSMKTMQTLGSVILEKGLTPLQRRLI